MGMDIDDDEDEDDEDEDENDEDDDEVFNMFHIDHRNSVPAKPHRKPALVCLRHRLQRILL